MKTLNFLSVSFVFILSSVALSNEGDSPKAKAPETMQTSEPQAKDVKDAKAEAPNSTSAASQYSCSMDNSKRTVRVAYEKEGAKVPCKVNYKRDASSDEEKVIYSAATQEGYCEQKAGEFVEKLKSTGWTCTTP